MKIQHPVDSGAKKEESTLERVFEHVVVVNGDACMHRSIGVQILTMFNYIIYIKYMLESNILL